MAFAVVTCSRCKEPWALELRHATATCPRCQAKVEVAKRRRLWEGDDAREAQAAAAQARLTGAAGPEAVLLTPQKVPRHDAPVGAAAAAGRGITNLSQRAEAVAVWLCQEGPASDGDLTDALVAAGLDAERAGKEIVRMLACDHLYEPRAGHYGVL